MANFKEASGDVEDYLPSSARVAVVPDWVMQDLKAGTELKLISQPLVDLLMN